MAKAKTVTKDPEVSTTVETPAPAEAPATVIESNNAFIVEDNTEAEPVEETPGEEIEVPLMDGFVQVNYV